jgi:two-component system sensor histidine kinase RegB
MHLAAMREDAGAGLMPPHASAQVRDEIRARWLVRVRWGSIAAQSGIVAIAATLAGVALPIGTLVSLSMLMASTNAWLAWRLRSARHVGVNTCGAMLVLDLVLTTVMLYLTGGSANPFTVFYLVLITVAAVTLGSRWTWVLAALAISSYAGLFLVRGPLPSELHDHTGLNFSQHLRVMWVALTMAAVLTTYFVTRLSRTIEQREREIGLVRERAARYERVAALTTLAADAVHQLATPLTTAMVAAGEVDRALSKAPVPYVPAIADDVRLIRAELQRCRAILDNMVGQAGGTIGEGLATVSMTEIISDSLSALSQDEARRVDVVVDAPSPVVVVPRQALQGALVNLSRNALQAADPPSRVDVRVTSGDGAIRVSVRDFGCGMGPDVISRAGDPYFSTRPPGEGRGLGLFLTRSLAERLGGRLVLDSAVGRGTTATLEFPAPPPPGASR